jgi:Sulfotransferase domain
LNGRIQRFGIIIGAMKAGTTAAFKALGQHPQIALSREKEPGFFAHSEKFALGFSSYEALWDWDISRHRIAVEASTDLAKDPDLQGGPQRIADTDRDFFIVYIVRNPVARIQSHYYMAAARNWPMLPLADGVDASAISYSSYHHQISKYAQVLPSRRLLVLSYEDLASSPNAILQRICSHFGLSGAVRFTLPLENTTRDQCHRPLLIRHLHDDGISVPQLRYREFRSWFNNLPEQIRLNAIHKIEASLKLTKDHCAFIREHLKYDMAALRKEFEVDISRWGFAS